MDSDPGGSLAFQIILLIVLIYVNAYYSLSELAVVSVNRAHIKNLAENGDKRAKNLVTLIEHPSRFLSVIQVCITFASFLQSAIAATGITTHFGDALDGSGIPYAKEIVVLLVTLLLIYINLVFGELLPKRIAMHRPEKFALTTAGPVLMTEKLMYPLIWMLSKTCAIFMRMGGVRTDTIEEVYSEEQILSILELGQESGYIDESGKEMIDNVFRFDDKLAYEIMTPRTDVYMHDINDPLNEYVDEMVKSRFSRIPYFDKDNDDIIGVLYMKDFMIQAKKTGFNRVAIRKLLTKPYFVPESKNIADLFEEMRTSKTHIAFLVDEYGGFSGIVTTEDLIEEVMGEISDEHDEPEPGLEKISDGVWVVDGGCYLEDLNDELGLHLESEEYETLGGLLIDQLGEISEEGSEENQVVIIDGCRFTIEGWKDRRIETVRLEILQNGGSRAPAEGTVTSS
ncbi:hypothetical protein AGMMS49983_05220 [Clostridia bacterium]|nr:hypothetical protein AGMMS49983_05220 [Clostridia bacterium]